MHPLVAFLTFLRRMEEPWDRMVLRSHLLTDADDLAAVMGLDPGLVREVFASVDSYLDDEPDAVARRRAQ